MSSLLVATTSGDELLVESQTSITLVTDLVGVVGGVLLVVATSSILLDVGPTGRLLD